MQDPRLARVQAVLPPLLAAAMTVVWVVVLPGALDHWWWFSDAAATGPLGVAVVHSGYGAPVGLPTQTGIGVLVYNGLAARLPIWPALWAAAGPLLAIATVALLVFAVRIVAGRFSAGVAAVVCIALPSVVAWEFLVPAAHGTTLAATSGLGLMLVACARAMRQRTRWLLAGIGAPLLAIAVESDGLVLIEAVAPGVLSIALLLLLRRWPMRSMLPLIAMLLATVPLAAGIALWMGAQHVVVLNQLQPHLSLHDAAVSAERAVTAMARMVSGSWYDQHVPLWGWGALACLALAAAAILLATARRMRQMPAATAAHAVFWTASAAALLAAFIVTGFGAAGGAFSTRYIDGVLFSVAALVALVPTTDARVRWALCAAAVLLTARAPFSAASLQTSASLPGPDYADLPALVAALKAQHLTHGYAGYWDGAYTADWHSQGSVTIVPVTAVCPAAPVGELCTSQLAAQAWYTPRDGASFLVLRSGDLPGGVCDPNVCVHRLPLAQLGQPVRVFTAGALSVVVWDYDIAARLRHSSP